MADPQLSEMDAWRIRQMTHRLELSVVWSNLSTLVHADWYVLSYRTRRGIWRALPVANQRGKELFICHQAAHLLHSVTGRKLPAYDPKECKSAENAVFAMLEHYSPRVYA